MRESPCRGHWDSTGLGVGIESGPSARGGPWRSGGHLAQEERNALLPLSVARRPPAFDSQRGGCAQDQSHEFRASYPNPVVAADDRTPIPGVRRWTVWERSNENEDPIVTEPWRVLKEGNRYRLDEQGVDAALCRSGWGPRPPDVALEVAALAVVGADARSLQGGGELPDTIPAATRTRVTAPAVRAEGNGVRVELSTHRVDRVAAFFVEHEESAELCVLRTRTGALQASCETLYHSSSVPTQR